MAVEEFIRSVRAAVKIPGTNTHTHTHTHTHTADWSQAVWNFITRTRRVENSQVSREKLKRCKTHWKVEWGERCGEWGWGGGI